jgi:hypothetical protein
MYNIDVLNRTYRTWYCIHQWSSTEKQNITIISNIFHIHRHVTNLVSALQW